MSRSKKQKPKKTLATLENFALNKLGNALTVIDTSLFMYLLPQILPSISERYFFKSLVTKNKHSSGARGLEENVQQKRLMCLCLQLLHKLSIFTVNNQNHCCHINYIYLTFI